MMPRKKLHKATLKGSINQNPDKIFKLGIKASLVQKKHEKEPKKHEKNKKDNVIDFLSYLKKKRGEEEQFEEEIKDPF